jgi:hypothetical protein
VTHHLGWGIEGVAGIARPPSRTPERSRGPAGQTAQQPPGRFNCTPSGWAWSTSRRASSSPTTLPSLESVTGPTFRRAISSPCQTRRQPSSGHCREMPWSPVVPGTCQRKGCQLSPRVAVLADTCDLSGQVLMKRAPPTLVRGPDVRACRIVRRSDHAGVRVHHAARRWRSTGRLQPFAALYVWLSHAVGVESPSNAVPEGTVRPSASSPSVR